MAKNQGIIKQDAFAPVPAVVQGANVPVQVSFEADDQGNPFPPGKYTVRLVSPLVPVLSAALVSPSSAGSKVNFKDHSIAFEAPAGPAGAVVADFELETLNLKPAQHDLRFELRLNDQQAVAAAVVKLNVTEPAAANPIRTVVTKDIIATRWTDDLVLYAVIKHATAAMSFPSYKAWMDFVLCSKEPPADALGAAGGGAAAAALAVQRDAVKTLAGRRYLPFNDTDAYRVLKVATEAFVASRTAVGPKLAATDPDIKAQLDRITAEINPVNPPADAADEYARLYLRALNQTDSALPYLYLVQSRMGGELKKSIFPGLATLLGDQEDMGRTCEGLLLAKLGKPIMVELIWSYWHEQGMLAQTLFAIRDRFQNKRSMAAPDPLATFEMSHLRPLNNILWGYIQDEQHRLTLTRRAYEYDHHYRLRLHGAAVPPMQTADSRSRFLEAFHNLLYMCGVFFKEDDDTNRKADAFPILNAIKEVHFLLSEGAHNQYGDLPTTSRIEMLMEQWMLARPEMQQFLPARDSVAYPEAWMAQVDAMKTIQGWTNTSVMYFHDLAAFGEQLLLSIRFNNWSELFDRTNAANWARTWRSEIQGYMHAYRTVTGVDLSAEPTDSRTADRNLDPSVHLLRRYEEQKRLGGAVRGGGRVPAIPTAGVRPALRPVPR